MDKIFLTLFNMSMCAGWLIVAVFVLRLILRRAPKWMRCVLWALVGLRLICPFSPESILSLMPSARIIQPDDVRYAVHPEIHSGIAAVDSTLNPLIRESFAAQPEAGASPLYILTCAAGFIWLTGLLLLTGYALFSYVHLRQITAASVQLRQNIRLCDDVRSPFILGVLHPVIYLPSALDADTVQYVLAHEQAHLSRRDHWWKMTAFLLLAVYWFHPLVWAAYIFFCRDMELACDEKAIKNWTFEKKKAYSHALVSCSSQRRTVRYCPLAFGETGIRERIKAILGYKKPAVRVIVVSALLCALTGACFLTNPVSEAKESPAQSGRSDTPAQPQPSGDAPKQTTDGDAGASPAQSGRSDTPAQPQPSSDAPKQAADGDAGASPAQSGRSDTPMQPQAERAGGSQTDGSFPDSFDPQTGYPLYDSLIASAASVLAHPQADAYEYERTLFTSAYFYSDMTWQTPGYLLMDLDGNGVDELLFGENHDDDWNGIIYNIYTISDGQLLHIADGWERNRYYLCENGCIANEGSSSASESIYRYYTYEGTALTPVESVLYDASSDPANPWFYAAGDPDTQEVEQTPVSESEAHRIMEHYAYVLPQFTPFASTAQDSP